MGWPMRRRPGLPTDVAPAGLGRLADSRISLPVQCWTTSRMG